LAHQVGIFGTGEEAEVVFKQVNFSTEFLYLVLQMRLLFG
jgi:hypothetical protein